MTPRVSLRRIAKVVNGGTPTPTAENWGGAVAWATPVDLGLVDGGRLSVTERSLTARGLATGSRSIPAGSLVLSTRAPIGYVALADIEMAFNQGCKGLVFRSGQDPRFHAYQLWAMREHLNALGTGSTFLELATESLLSVPVSVPSFDNQRRIADFLDDQVLRIDESVGLRREEIELLKSRLHSVAHAAVTGRGSPAAAATDLAWAEELPVHWSVVRLATIARLGTGHTPSKSEPSYWVDCDIPWLTTTDVKHLRSDSVEALNDTEVHISESGLRNSAAVMHPAGTVGLCRTSASAGYSAIMGVPMATSQDFAVWRPSPYLVPGYLLWCLRAMRSDLLDRLAMGSTHKTIYFPDLEGIRVPLPPIDEQRAIAERLSDEVGRMVEARREMTAQIDALQERKRSLITAAVTGEFEVSTASGRGV